MTRRLLTAALALSVAGGVYLASAPAQASNMGFKLERDIDYRRNAAGVGLRNVYWVTFPYFNGLGDLANSLAAQSHKCVGETGGPAAGDGWINVDDMICDFWQARLTTPGTAAGTFSVTYFNRGDCLPRTRNATFRVGAYVFSGDLFPPDDGDADPSNNPDLWTSHGYQVNLAAQPGTSPTNRVIIVGSHDPAFPGLTIAATPTPPACVPGPGVICCGTAAAQRELIAVPYHTMYRSAVEILCGLEGSDWTDNGLAADGVTPDGTAGDGLPDSLDECDTSIFDGLRAIAVSTFINDEIVNGVQTCPVRESFGNIVFTGCTDFDLIPGEAYLTNILRLHFPATTFLSPHF